MVDTMNKRGSVVGMGGSGPVLPHPDGSINAGDRAQTAGEYRGSVVTGSETGTGFGARMLYPYNPRTRRARFVR